MSRILVLVLLLTSVVLAPASPDAPVRTSPAAAAAQPDVLLVYVDDMRADDLAYMPYTRSLFDRGTSFTEAISPHPLCCPARAELMTGQYAQNNGVHHNRGAWGGFEALARAGQEQLSPEWFRAAGYSTGYVGKYLNGYAGGDIPGVDVTDALTRRPYAPASYHTWNNGTPNRHRKHQTIWTGRRTAELAQQWADRPFFLTAAFLAPHSMKRSGHWVPPVPPKGYDRLRPGDEVPPSFSDPAYDEADLSDKPADVRDNAPVDREKTLARHRARVLSLYAVDDSMRTIVRSLKRAGTWGDTVLLFTSDNGYQMGEHRTRDKDLPYQESLRVPLLVRGPGVPAGTVDDLVTTVDVPVTLAALAGVTPGREVDGTDALSAPPGRAVLIQSGTEDAPWDWRGVYTRRWTYVEHTTGERELYDRQADPHELESLDGRAGSADEQARLARLLDELEGCAGSGCVVTGS